MFYGVRKRGHCAIYNSLSFDKSFDKWITLGPREFEIFACNLSTGKLIWVV